jgi:hypothetical protein
MVRLVSKILALRIAISHLPINLVLVQNFINLNIAKPKLKPLLKSKALGQTINQIFLFNKIHKWGLSKEFR